MKKHKEYIVAHQKLQPEKERQNKRNRRYRQTAVYLVCSAFCLLTLFFDDVEECKADKGAKAVLEYDTKTECASYAEKIADKGRIYAKAYDIAQ